MLFGVQGFRGSGFGSLGLAPNPCPHQKQPRPKPQGLRHVAVAEIETRASVAVWTAMNEEKIVYRTS